MTDNTQAAAQHCADLANAEANPNDTIYDAQDFAPETSLGPDNTAFRREVEAKQAMIREVLALLECADKPSWTIIAEARAILRDNLLPDPAPTPTPTLLEEFQQAHSSIPSDAREAIAVFADWIAKREKEG